MLGKGNLGLEGVDTRGKIFDAEGKDVAEVDLQLSLLSSQCSEEGGGGEWKTKQEPSRRPPILKIKTLTPNTTE